MQTYTVVRRLKWYLVDQKCYASKQGFTPAAAAAAAANVFATEIDRGPLGSHLRVNLEGTCTYVGREKHTQH